MPTKKALKKSRVTTKKVVKKPLTRKQVSVATPRIRKLTKRKDRKRKNERLRIVQKQRQLPAAWLLLGFSLRHLYRHKKLFLGILLVYAILYVALIKGISANFQLGSLRANLEATFKGKLNSLDAGVQLFGLLLGTAGATSSETAGIYQVILITLTSLALIWALRNSFGKETRISIKESFYKSTAQLVPFMAVCGLLLIQLVPALIVTSLFSAVHAQGTLSGWFQSSVALVILGAGIAWTFFMISSTMFALYIVTLPNAKPLESLRAARELVRYRRVFVVRKVFFLPIAMLVFSAAILLPLIIFIPIAAEVLFLVFTILLLGVVHSYLYTLYRSLIRE